ncbi:MAG: preprotein translocase subunit SecA [Pseudomonadota bacterium]
MSLLTKVIGTRNERFLKSLQPLIARINMLEPRVKELKDEEFPLQIQALRERVQKEIATKIEALPANPDKDARKKEERTVIDAALDAVLPETFALVREAGWRVLNMRHFDVQLIGGIVLHQGRIAEMKTGEGKTLVATLPAVLNALAGRGVHVVTVNDYLASRDAEWMGRIYRYLGLTVGVVVHGLSDQERQQNYGCDITYGQNNEFGFDYLRDNMKFQLRNYVQRDLHFAITDEVDSILIDEARTPLIISGPAEESTDKYAVVNAIIPRLKKDVDYTVDEKSHTVVLTEEGVPRIEKLLSVQNLFDPRNIEILHHVNQALRAHTMYKRDVDYVVDQGEVKIVDEHTGRIMEGRRWSDGLHQAVEAKEGVKIQNENQTLATVTFQNYFRMYGKLAGMTGTADTEAEEFAKIYSLEVNVIPTNKVCVRADNNDLIYKTEDEKFRAVVEDIADCSSRGQPVLVGTTSVEKSEVLSKYLKRRGIQHEVLNAKQHRREAEIVAQAGRKGQITIATNMAGRGTDILLGGNPEFMARAEVIKAEGVDMGEIAKFQWLSGRPDLINVDSMAARDADPREQPAAYSGARDFYVRCVKRYGQVLDRYNKQCAAEKEEVVAAGGLHIIGTERHEARRIDNQLRGRSGRQGDPGSSRFYLSLQDDLMRIFGTDRLTSLMDKLGMEDDVPIEHKWVNKSIENAQKRVEGMHFDQRKNVLEYDDVMNLQRKAIYGLRREVLGGDDLHDKLLDLFEDLVVGVVEPRCPDKVPAAEYDVEGIVKELFDATSVRIEVPRASMTSRDDVLEMMFKALEKAYTYKESMLGAPMLRQLEQYFYLQTIDYQWKDHLQAMDHLREGIYLRGYGQKDPKQEYKREGYALFTAMMGRIGADVVEKVFKVQVREEENVDELNAQRQRAAAAAAKRAVAVRGAVVENSRAAAAGEGERPEASGDAGRQQTTVRRNMPKVGRNEPCPCGSGKKYKNCCLPKDEAAA